VRISGRNTRHWFFLIFQEAIKELLFFSLNPRKNAPALAFKNERILEVCGAWKVFAEELEL
jgi:hypothetical protein